MTFTTHPTRVPVPCSACTVPVAFVSSALVIKAQVLSPWRGWGLGTVLSHASTLLKLRCHACEAKGAPRPAEPAAPTLF